MQMCSNSSSQQPGGAAFCDNCGAALGGVAPAVMPPTALSPSVPVSPAPAAAPAPLPPTVACSSCGAQLEPGSNFCDMCGAPVGAVALPAPMPTPTLLAPTPPVALTPAPVYPVAGVQGRFVVQPTNATLPFPPGKTEIVVGREDPVSGIFPEIDLTDHGGDEGGVSRQHARIFGQGDQVSIEDLNSTNYTYVNQQKLTPGQPQPLNSGDEVQVGQVKLVFYALVLSPVEG